MGTETKLTFRRMNMVNNWHIHTKTKWKWKLTLVVLDHCPWFMGFQKWWFHHIQYVRFGKRKFRYQKVSKLIVSFQRFNSLSKNRTKIMNYFGYINFGDRCWWQFWDAGDRLSTSLRVIDIVILSPTAQSYQYQSNLIRKSSEISNGLALKYNSNLTST